MPSFTGSAGNESYAGGAEADTIDGAGGTDILSGGGGGDTIDGGDGNDSLYSGTLSPPWSTPWNINPFTPPLFDIGAEIDILRGGAGNDMIHAGYGDNVDGGAGIDDLVLSLGGAAAGVTVTFKGFGPTQTETSNAITIGGGTIKNVERLAWIDGSAFADTITFESFSGSAPPIFGRGGDDVITSRGYGSIYGGDGNDTINGSSAHIWGEAGNDTIYSAYSIVEGGAGNDKIYGGGRIDGGAGADTIVLEFSGSEPIARGGAGNDRITGSEWWDFIYGGAGADIIDGGGGDDYLQSDGVDEDDLFDNGIERDRIFGGEGNDTISIGYGDDADGGEGFDTLRIDTPQGAATEAINIDLVLVDGAATVGGGTIRNIESISALGGTGFNDTISVGGFLDIVSVAGYGGDDRLTGTSRVYFHGGAGNDELTGSNDADSLDGSIGDDRLFGGGGNDSLRGDDGDDWFEGGAGDDRIDGGAGIDTASYAKASGGVKVELLWAGVTSSGADGADQIDRIENLVGSAHNDTLKGSDGVNVIDGGAGDDTIGGQGGDDRLTGGLGNDILVGGTGADVMEGGAGNDSYEVDAAGDSIIEVEGGGSGDEVVSTFDYTIVGTWLEGIRLIGAAKVATGNGVDNVLTGNGQNNVLHGAQGNDVLFGMGGHDVLAGGVGADEMSGGLGQDSYEVENEGDNVVELAGEGTDIVKVSLSAYALTANVENLTFTGTGAFKGVGNDLGNVMITTGAAGDDVLDGGAGNDRLESGVGVDLLTGGAGDDLLDGGAGADAMTGGLGNDRYFISEATDTVTELSGEGTDRVDSAITYSLAGRYIEELALTGSAAINATGNSFDNLLIGNSGANVLNGGTGADRMEGGGGNDRYAVDNVLDRTLEGEGGGADVVDASVSFSIAGSHVETLRLIGVNALNGTGSDIANRIVGNGAANRLDGGAGDDLLEGGTGNDVYIVDNSADRVIEKDGEGIDLVESSASFSLAGQFAENLTLTGIAAVDGTGNDLANILVGNNQANVLNGGGGADTMQGRKGDDTYHIDQAGDRLIELEGEGSDTVNAAVSFSLVGLHVEALNLTGLAAIDGTGNGMANRIVGNGAGNVLTGGGGNDRLDGGAGADTMIGGIGNDVYVVDSFGDKVVEKNNEGTDTVETAISYSLAGQYIEVLRLVGTANSSADGNNQVNTLYGNDGANRIDGKSGADRMEGGQGDDYYLVDDSGDKVIEANFGGEDAVEASVSYSLAGQYAEHLLLTGTALTGTGNSLDNNIFGNALANDLDGGTGSDILAGDLGNDRLRGGMGQDFFLFDRALGAANIDTIIDFWVPDDIIVLHSAVFTKLAPGALAATAFVVGTAAADAGDRIIHDRTGGHLYYDADGAGGSAAVLFAHVASGAPITADHFLIL